jgi:hypothetical protein
MSLWVEFVPPKPVGLHGVLVVMACAGLITLLRIRSGEGWVPILDSANLAIHEAGHPIVGLLSSRLAVYGGTIFQLLFPLLVAADFWRRGELVASAVGVVWLGESLLNVARYMADARAHVLPLTRPEGHDWTEIFSRWGVLQSDTLIADLTGLLGGTLMMAATAWVVWAWWRDSEYERYDPWVK